MMAFLFGQSADAVRETQRFRKICEAIYPLESLDSLPFQQCPFRNLRLQLADLRLGHAGGIATTGCALFIRERVHSDGYKRLFPSPAQRKRNVQHPPRVAV